MAGLTPVEVVNRVKEMAVPPEAAAEGKHRVCADSRPHSCSRAVCTPVVMLHKDTGSHSFAGTHVVPEHELTAA
jgi:hypothetical protein